jgi:hypothetical protein
LEDLADGSLRFGTHDVDLPLDAHLHLLEPVQVANDVGPLQQCVVSAITKARLAGRPVSEEDLIRTAVKIVPLSRTMNEQINHIRAWAFERAVRASLRE